MGDGSGIITGAGSGIGRGAALEFASSGCRLILVDRDPTKCQEVASEIRATGGEALAYEADIRDAHRMDEIAQVTVDKYGTIDFLIANAGVTYQSSTRDGNPEQWKAVFDTNVLGTMLSVRAVLPFMEGQSGGHIFLVASMSGRVAHVGEPAYIASKFAIVGFGHALRMEVEPLGVRVTLVEPGLVETPILAGNPRALRMLEQITPLTPANVGQVMLFAFNQPDSVAISEIALRPMGQ